MIAPSVGGHVRLLEHGMILAVEGQEVADLESGLSAANNYGVDVSSDEMFS